MKTKFAIAAIALALSSSAAFADNSESYGTITLEGKVLAASCTIDIDGTKNKNATIILDPAYKTDLRDNTPVKTKDFSIAFSNCTVAKNDGMSDSTLDATVSVAWDASTKLANADKGYLENTVNSGGASGVYLALYNKGDLSNVIIPGKTNYSKSAKLDNGSASFDYTVGYITPDASKAGPGALKSDIVYMVSYQ